MLLSLASILLAFWCIGMATSTSFGGLIYLALFVSGVAFFLRVLMAASGSFSR